MGCLLCEDRLAWLYIWSSLSLTLRCSTQCPHMLKRGGKYGRPDAVPPDLRTSNCGMNDEGNAVKTSLFLVFFFNSVRERDKKEDF